MPKKPEPKAVAPDRTKQGFSLPKLIPLKGAESAHVHIHERPQFKDIHMDMTFGEHTGIACLACGGNQAEKMRAFIEVIKANEKRLIAAAEEVDELNAKRSSKVKTKLARKRDA